MKGLRLLLAQAAVAAFFSGPGPYPAPADADAASRSGWFCPWCGGQYLPFDPAADRQETMRFYHHWMGFDGRRSPAWLYGPLDQARAVQIVESCLRSSGNPELRLAGVMDGGGFFEARITDQDGMPAGRLLVDKRTGALFEALTSCLH